MKSQWVDATAMLRRRPTDLASTAWVVAAYGTVALLIGFGQQLFTWTAPALWELAVFPIVLLIYPSLVEEFIFRGLLLPLGLASASTRRQVVAVGLNTGAFVLYHPLNHWTLSLSETDLFVDPAFLVIVAMLGASCSYLRIRTGSLWSPIALHWLTVVVWNLFLGRPG